MTPGSDLEKLTHDLGGARVLVTGDLMLDTYLIGEAGRISPEAPVPVVKLGRRDYRLGGAANSAMNIAALGGVPVLVGAIGRDESAALFLDIAHKMGFRTDGIISDPSIVTTSKVRIVAGNQQIVRIDEELRMEWSGELAGKILDFLEKTIPEVDAVAVSDYAKGFINAEIMIKIHDLSRMNRIPVLVDPKPPNIALYKGSDLLKPNRKEAAELAGMDITDDSSCDIAAGKLLADYSPRALLITRGPEGMHLYQEGMEPIRVKARVSRVYDVSGAGDTVLATLSMGYAKGLDPVDSCRLAAAAAAVAVTKPGTSTVSIEELSESVRSIEP